MKKRLYLASWEIIYPKIHGILSKMSNYNQFTQPLLGQKIRKSSKVFDDKKVTDHHAIIPTGVEKNLAGNEWNVYDAIARQFIAAFYPDCIVAKTTVIGESNGVKFKATGKEILEEGWRVLFPKPKKNANSKQNNSEKNQDEVVLPSFKVGETGEHEPALVKKMTQPPKQFTEATLLRSMETAGKQIDDDELRDLMKANGIGRPSTRANIIETLFRRKYIQRRRKLIVPTEMGVQLIDTIQNDLLKSPELTGQWEKQLREIEEGTFGAKQFIENMQNMVSQLVEEVRMSKGAKLAPPSNNKRPIAKSETKSISKNTPDRGVVGATCPKCEKGKLLKGNTAYGCSEWKSGCDFRLPFEFLKKEIPPKQLERIISHGSTILLSGFKQDNKSIKGKLYLDENKVLKIKLKETPNLASTPAKTIRKTKQGNSKKTIPDKLTCPRCQQGKILKGKTAYGCSRWKEGCDYRVGFDEVRAAIGERAITKELVWEILSKK